MENRPGLLPPPSERPGTAANGCVTIPHPSFDGREGPDITLLAFTNGKIETQAGIDAGRWAEAIQLYYMQD